MDRVFSFTTERQTFPSEEEIFHWTVVVGTGLNNYGSISTGGGPSRQDSWEEETIHRTGLDEGKGPILIPSERSKKKQ